MPPEFNLLKVIVRVHLDNYRITPLSMGTNRTSSSTS